MLSQMQPLEPRRLLSASAVLNHGLLTVTGTNRADEIVVTGMLFTGVTVKVNGKQLFASSDVSRVVVHAGNGNDRITYNNDGPGVPERRPAYVTLIGGNGDDRIVASSFRAPGATVRGGNGNDDIRVTNSLSSVDAGRSVIYGENGNDVIETSNGFGAEGATVFGGNGNDRISATSWEHSPNGHVLYGENGDDEIRVTTIDGDGPGHRLFGGNGKDRLFGGSADDFLCGGKGRDRLDGGGGFDTAERDREDAMLNIEHLI